MKYFLLILSIAYFLKSTGQEITLKKQKDFIIYYDSIYHSAFPSVIKDNNGDFLLIFRRAPNRLALGEEEQYHTDPNSLYISIRSKNGKHWDESTAKQIFAHNFGGINDPCILKTNSGELIVTGYVWSYIKEKALKQLKEPYRQHHSGAIFGGGFTIRSDNNGFFWNGPFETISLSEEQRFNIFKEPIQAFNRGALAETHNGRLLWSVIAAYTGGKELKTSVSIVASDDKGKNWKEFGIIAKDSLVSFNETSLIQTAKGDIVAFMRTDNNNGNAAIARSKNGGRSFDKWQDIGFHAEPIHALKLPDNNILITYGNRKEPYGIRAKVLNPEATNFRTAKEFIIRDDGIDWDMGYPWAVNISPKKILVVYYMKDKSQTAYIAGTILKIKE